jgi:hypothetical protein
VVEHGCDRTEFCVKTESNVEDGRHGGEYKPNKGRVRMESSKTTIAMERYAAGAMLIERA